MHYLRSRYFCKITDMAVNRSNPVTQEFKKNPGLYQVNEKATGTSTSYYLCPILGNQLPRDNRQVSSRLPKEVLFANFYTAVPENVICCCDMEINVW